MADIDKIRVRNTGITYDIADAATRAAIGNIETMIPDGASSENKLATKNEVSNKTDIKAIANIVETGDTASALINVNTIIWVEKLTNTFDSHLFKVTNTIDAGDSWETIKSTKLTSVSVAGELKADANSISNIQAVIPLGASASNKLVDTSAMNTELNGKVNVSSVGANGGVAELDTNGKVPSSQLPSYVDDVLEYPNKSSFPAVGETGKIYLAVDTGKIYRWSGSTYIEISESLALGETSGTAYRGDRGKTAYDHASAKGAAFASGLYKITTNAEGHVTEVTAVAKSDITALGIPGQDTIYDDTEVRGLIAGVNGKVGDITQLDTEARSDLVAAVNELVSDFAGVDEEVDKLEAFSGSQTLLDSEGNEILDSSNNRILDTEYGAAGVVTTLSNIVSWFKNNLSHLIQDSGYTQTKELYEILNS